MSRGIFSLSALMALVLMIVLCAPLASFADESEPEFTDELSDEFALLQEEDVVLTAAKHKQKIGFSPAAVIVITRKEIEESGATTLMDLLRLYPAIFVYQFDPLYPTAMIRATIRVMIMLDGREVNTEIYPAPFYELIPVGLPDIERIEIIFGPNSALYGANAVSAIINITSRKPGRTLKADFSLAGGEHGNLRAGGRIEGGIGPLALQGTFRIDRSAAWMDIGSIPKDLIRSTIKANLKLGPLDLTADGGLVAGEGRIYGAIGYMNFSRLMLAYAQLTGNVGDLQTRVYWYGLRTHFVLDLDLVYPATGQVMGIVPPFDLRGDTVQAEAQYDLNFFDGKWLVIAGSDFRYTNFRSETFVDPEVDQYSLGIFLHTELKLIDRLLFSLSGRFDYNNVTDPALSPRGSIVYNPAGEHYIRLSAGRAFRKPTMIESSANFKIEADPAFSEVKTLFETQGISNPDLKNEILTGIELGYRGAMLGERLRVSADAYFNFNRNWVNFTNEIHFRPPPFQLQIDLANSRVGYGNDFNEDYDVLGLYVDISGEPVEMLTLFIRGEYRYDWKLSESITDKKVPQLQLASGGTLRLPFGLRLHLSLAYVSARDDELRDPGSSLVPVLWMHMPSIIYLMAALNYRIVINNVKVDLGFSLFNPFGKSFREKSGVIIENGTNFGGEIIDTRAMLTARLQF
jgi:outer membrane receptor protein involved in Fe transport